MAGNWHTVSDGLWTRHEYGMKPYEGRCRIDPYFVWADVTNCVDLGGAPALWVPVILELRRTAREFADDVAKYNRTGRPWIQVHPMYRNPASGLEGTTFCTALVTKRFFEQVLASQPAGSSRSSLIDDVMRFELGLPVVAGPDIERMPPKPRRGGRYRKAKGPAFVVGIIDDGFAVAHSRFKKPDGSTRIDFFWDQGYYSPAIDRPEYGRVHTNVDIDGYMAECTSEGRVNEDAVYRLAEYREVRRRLAHGTHITDIACGWLPRNRQASPREVDALPHIVCVQVQVPSRRTRDRSTGWVAVRVLDGLRYILDRADRLTKGCDVVANLSFGNIAGPHDGSSVVERAMDQLIISRRTQKLSDSRPRFFDIVIAAGNSNLSRCHAAFSVAARQTHALNWRVLPDDPTPNFLEIWLPAETAGDKGVEITIRTPFGDECDNPPLTRGRVYTWKPGAQALCTAVYLDQVATGDRPMILVAIAPTRSHDPDRETAPSGEWGVSITNRNSRGELKIQAWIQRDETPFDFPRHGRQSRFEDPNYQRFDEQGRVKADDKGNAASYVKREGTINSIATGRETVVIGGFRRSDGAAAPYSSSGPAEPAPGQAKRVAPDAAAVSDESISLHGVVAAASRSGSVIAMNGTSVAAPQITRRLANRISKIIFIPVPHPPSPIPILVPRPVPRNPVGRKEIEELAKEQEAQPAPAGKKQPATGRRASRTSRIDKGTAGRLNPTRKQKPPEERVGHGRIDLPPLVDRKRESERD